MSLLAGIQALAFSGAMGAAPFYYAWTDYHGAKDWEEFKSAAEKRGAVFDLVKLREREAPADQHNFASLPEIRELFDERYGMFKADSVASLMPQIPEKNSIIRISIGCVISYNIVISEAHNCTISHIAIQKSRTSIC